MTDPSSREAHPRLAYIEDKVRARVHEATCLPVQRIHLKARMLDDLGLDSLSLTGFLIGLEEEFFVTFSDDSVRGILDGRMETLGDLAAHIVSHWGTGAPPRPGWRTHAPLQPICACDPFTQLGGVLAPDEWLAGPLFLPAGMNAEGMPVYERQTDGMRCVLLPEAEVTLGAPDAPNARKANLDSFLMDADTVSNEAYCRFLNSVGVLPPAILLEWFGAASEDQRREHMQLRVTASGAWLPAPGTAEKPMVLVSWYGANAYSLWANRRDWRYYRGDGGVPAILEPLPIAARPPSTGRLHSFLPSESEWEYAARGMEPRRYPWGSQEPTNGMANVGLHRPDRTYSRDLLPTSPVSARCGMSPFGLHHMCGNVWQWCRDIFNEDTAARAERGGSWASPPALARCHYRRGRKPRARDRALGFRCVSEPGRCI